MPGLCRCCPVLAEREPRRGVHASGVALIAAALILSSCATPRPAPVTDRLPPAKTTAQPAVQAATKPTVSTAPAARPARVAPSRDAQRPEFYTVKQGDTLYSIALEFDLDYRELASWNSIDPGRIYVGQQLRLAQLRSTVTTPLRASGGSVETQALDGSSAGRAVISGARAEPRGVRVPYSDQAYTQMAGIKPASTPKPGAQPLSDGSPALVVADDVDWAWPVRGKVVAPFKEPSNKGIGIAGKVGQPVMAAGPGEVIYVGTGIPSLGKFIIIQHNKLFLSVYAHNSELLVKQNQIVTRGQKIAEMGSSAAGEAKLHFEIRRQGVPLDPAKLLPPG